MTITLSETGYCAATDVGALLQQLTIDSGSDPTDAEVEAFITQDFHVINGMLVGQDYSVPVAQAGGSLAVDSGNFTTSQAHSMGDRSVALTGTGLDGYAQRGDFITFASQTQKYMVNLDATADDSNGIVLPIAPALETDLASGVVVTYTASVNAKNILKHLNALGAALRTMLAAYGAAGGVLGDDYEALKEMREELFSSIKKGDVQLLGVEHDVAQGVASESIPLTRY